MHARTPPFVTIAALAGAALLPAHPQVLFDDGIVCVQEVRLAPGDEGRNRRRPFRIVRVIEGGTMQRIHPDGSAEDLHYRAGETHVHPAEGPFVPRNVGSSDIVLHIVALKDEEWSGIDEAGWITLINGAEGLENWESVGDANWRPEGGAVVADAGNGGFLVSRDAYRDFYLRAEFLADTETNSGIFVRVADRRRVTSRAAYEVNLHDARGEPAFATGSVVGVAPAATVARAAGRWSVAEIVARGPRLVVRVNGVQTVDIEDEKRAEGPIALQYRNGPIRWRRVQVRPL